VLKYRDFDNFIILNGTAIVTFDPENVPNLMMFTGAGVLKKKNILSYFATNMNS
jgi:hypothetical protein